MKQTYRIIVMTLALFFAVLSVEAKKRALTIFVGEYPQTSGWSQIHSDNDKTIIMGTLRKLGFLAEDIVCLQDSYASYRAIKKAMDDLVGSCRLGDEVYIHFSCHGQWITDIDGDETMRSNGRDQYDEAIIPYDAKVSYNWRESGYRGENHLTDDELNDYLRRICERIGKKGCLLVVIDACHSGDMQRVYNENDEVFMVRGSSVTGKSENFEIPSGKRICHTLPPDPDCFVISACQEFESNHECKVDGKIYGRLSYAVSRAWKSGMTQEMLQSAIQEQYEILSIQSPLPGRRTQTPHFVPSPRYSDRRLF